MHLTGQDVRLASLRGAKLFYMNKIVHNRMTHRAKAKFEGCTRCAVFFAFLWCMHERTPSNLIPQRMDDEIIAVDECVELPPGFPTLRRCFRAICEGMSRLLAPRNGVTRRKMLHFVAYLLEQAFYFMPVARMHVRLSVL